MGRESHQEHAKPNREKRCGLTVLIDGKVEGGRDRLPLPQAVGYY